MPIRPTVFLFDIDGTLILSRGAGRRALQKAFRARFGRDDMLDFRFDGFTDPLIIHTALQRMGVNVDEGNADLVGELLDEYLRSLALESADSFSSHPGVLQALDLIDATSDVALGLGTGNIVRGARIKLGHVGLFDRFAFGGFGDDHIDRDRILLAGAQRGAQRLGVALDACRVVVIGDTPRDVQAASDIKAESIAVATGYYSVDQLREAGATHVFATLEEDGVVEALLGQGPGAATMPQPS